MIVVILRQPFGLKRIPRKPTVKRHNAYAQDFFAPDELLHLIQKNIRTVRPLLEVLEVYSLCAVVEILVAVVNCSLLVTLWPAVSRTAPDTPTPTGIISWPVVCRQFHSLSFSVAKLDHHFQRTKLTGHIAHM
jgi:hypothetical protein